MIEQHIKNEIKQAAKIGHPEEICGFVLDLEKGQKWLQVENKHEDKKNSFLIDAAEYLKHKDNILCVVHSHTDESAAPSFNDMQQQLLGEIPWAIVATDGNEISDVEIFGWNIIHKNLIGREFLHGIRDCYSLIRDWYYVRKGILLHEQARDNNWWENQQDLYNSNIDKFGFKFVSADVNDAQVGDMLYMRIRSRRCCNHAALYVGDGLLIHHLDTLKSTIEPVSRWVRRIERVVRYVGTSDASWLSRAANATIYEI